MPPDRTRARIGPMEFAARYGDPDVDVRSESNTVEKNTVDDNIFVQVIGRRADRITVDGIILEDNIEDLDKLIGAGEVSVRTHRWSGVAVVLETSSTYTHSYDIAPPEEVESEWLYNVTIDLIEVDEIPSHAHEFSGDTEEIISRIGNVQGAIESAQEPETINTSITQ